MAYELIIYPAARRELRKKSGKFIPRLELETEVVPAELLNEAGIVGAALAHAENSPASHSD